MGSRFPITEISLVSHDCKIARYISSNKVNSGQYDLSYQELCKNYVQRAKGAGICRRCYLQQRILIVLGLAKRRADEKKGTSNGGVSSNKVRVCGM